MPRFISPRQARRKAYRMRRKRAKVARGRVGKNPQPVHYFKRTRFYPASLVVTSGVTSYQGVAFTLGDLPDVTDFTALYDQYKISKVVVKWLPRGNQSDLGISGSTALTGNISRMFSVLDFDDDATPSSIDQLCQYQNMKITGTHQVHSRVFKPAVRIEAATGLGTTANIIKRDQWIDVTNTNIKHYGVKLAIQPPPNSASITYDAMVTMYLAFKNVR